MSDFEKDFPLDRPELTPSLEEQQRRLDGLLADNFSMLAENVDFMSAAFTRYLETGRHSIDLYHMSIGVSRSMDCVKLNSGGLEERTEYLELRCSILPIGDPNEATIIGVGRRIVRGEVVKIVPFSRFTAEEVEMIANMVDDLMLAKMSGQIPNLDEETLDKISV